MSVPKYFSVPSFLNHSNDTVPETIVTVKSKGLDLAKAALQRFEVTNRGLPGISVQFRRKIKWLKYKHACRFANKVADMFKCGDRKLDPVLTLQ